MKEFNLEIDPNVDEVFDEGTGNSFLALRRLRWSPDGAFKYDIRKWFTSSDGKEVAGKGVSFITEEGPTNLVSAMLKHNLVQGRELLTQMGRESRPDYLDAMAYSMHALDVSPDEVKKAYDECQYEEEEYFDPKEVL